MIQAWKQDSNTNVSVNICSALRENGETVHQLATLRRDFAELGELLKLQRLVDGVMRTGSISKEDWERFFWTGE